MTAYNKCWFVILGFLAGCGTNPDVLQQANQGVSLTTNLQSELVVFQETEKASENYLIQAVKMQLITGVQVSEPLARNLKVLKAVGDKEALRIVDNLTELSDGLTTISQTTDSALIALDKKFSTLITPLPSTAATTTALQLKFAELGRELPIKQQREELEAHISTVRKNVADNKANIAANKASAPPAP